MDWKEYRFLEPAIDTILLPVCNNKHTPKIYSSVVCVQHQTNITIILKDIFIFTNRIRIMWQCYEGLKLRHRRTSLQWRFFNDSSLKLSIEFKKYMIKMIENTEGSVRLLSWGVWRGEGYKINSKHESFQSHKYSI